MDLLLTPGNGVAPARGALYTPEGARSCAALCDELARLGQDLRIAAWIPRDTDEACAQALLIEALVADRHLPVLALVEIAYTDSGFPAGTALRLAAEAILVDDGALDRGAVRRRAAFAERVAEARTQGVTASWRLWLRRSGAPGGYARLVSYPDELFVQREQPLFSLGDAEDAPEHRPPDFMLAEPLSCALFETVVTVAGDGRVYMCPRYAGIEAGAVCGLPDTTLSGLFSAKGRFLDVIGRMRGCLVCENLGRFFWPAGRGPEIERLMEEARRVPDAPAGDAGSGQTRSRAVADTFDLNEASAEVQAQALADFAHRLDAWAEFLDGVDEPERRDE